MAALPVIPLSSTDLIQNGGAFFVEGGPAAGVYAFASTDDYPAEGGAAQPVYVVSDNEVNVRGVVRGGATRMKQVARGSRPTIGGAARPVYVLGGAFDPTTVAFLPTQIAGLSLWLDAADPTTLFQDSALTTPAVADAAPVGGAKDKSGQLNHVLQATAGKRATLKINIQNGRPVLRFASASDQNLVSAAYAVALAQPNTIFIVASVIKASGTDAYLYDGVGAGARNSLRREVSEFITAYAGTDVALQYAITSPLAMTVWETIFNGAASNLLANGVSKSTANPGTNAMDALTLGINRAQTAGVGLSGDVAEMLIYNALLTAPQRAQVRAYLGAKWGIAIV